MFNCMKDGKWLGSFSEIPEGAVIAEVIPGDASMEWDGSEWVFPLAEYKIRRKADVSSVYEEKVADGFLYEGHTYQLDESSILTVNNFMAGLISGEVNPHDGYYRDADNNDVAMTDVELSEFLKSIGRYYAGLRKTTHTLKDSIDAASTLAEVDAVDINSPWP